MRHLVCFSLAALAACSSDGFDDTAASAEGIYKVSSFTRNEDACLPGGSSQLGQDGFAFAVSHDIFGVRVLDVYSCASPADCRAKRAKLDGTGGFGIEFNYTVSAAEGDLLVGDGAQSGFSDNGVCREGAATHTSLSFDGTTLHIEQEVTRANDYPVTSDGFCTTDGARRAARGNSCSQLEVLTADFVEPL